LSFKYSGSVEYRQKVIEVFSNEFKNKFRPLTSFLKYSDYLQLLLSCPYVFFNSKRQIGLGNLLFSIYLGSVVILNSNNPLFHFFYQME
ncbi:TDP-N-acetylfucosamine:lipid II N-acetylfucosaminyltransferase, partial [Cyclobacterium qasimii]|uniref:TDP-N-acetylfucosamine:lipid II N-acetylfucosaminyltransferase n=1 Tax=Cyclobacterium qasimii TaxID=1350429 RepID=UPI0005901FD1